MPKLWNSKSSIGKRWEHLKIHLIIVDQNLGTSNPQITSKYIRTNYYLHAFGPINSPTPTKGPARERRIEVFACLSSQRDPFYSETINYVWRFLIHKRPWFLDLLSKRLHEHFCSLIALRSDYSVSREMEPSPPMEADRCAREQIYFIPDKYEFPRCAAWRYV